MRRYGLVAPDRRTPAARLPHWETAIALCLAALTSTSTGARADSDPKRCGGVDFDAKRPLVASRISARPHVNFIKDSDEDPACPSNKEACRKKTYVVPGDIVLNGRVYGTFTCVAYQSFHTRKQNWTKGWMPTSSLTPAEPMPSPKTADWIGDWSHPGGMIAISAGDGGKLKIEGEHIHVGAQSVHSGVLGAVAEPAQGMIAFV